MDSKIAGFITCLLCGLLVGGCGLYMLITGNPRIMHGYHYATVAPAQMRPLARWAGAGLLVCGVGCALIVPPAGMSDWIGIAGIAGSGQRELLETIAGLLRPSKGTIVYHDPATGKDENLVKKSPAKIRELGVRLSFVPEDRLGMGLVGSMDIIDNMMLRSYKRGIPVKIDKKHTVNIPLVLDRKRPRQLAERIIKELEVVTPSTHTPVRRLSGGNIQKVLVGREIASAPTVFMAAYPVRGLDINSSYTIYNLLNEQKESGVAVIYVGEDLDVLIELCDRIMVICAGKVTGIVDGRTTDKETIGLMMTDSLPSENSEEVAND